MGSGDDIDFEDILKDQMDFEAFRDAVISLIWQDDADGLRRLCRQQALLPFFVEKAISEISPDNHWNDVLYLIARKLIEADPQMLFLQQRLEEKKQLVGNATGGREILAPFVHEEITTDEFMEKVRIIGDTPTFMGLDSLVAENPQLTRSFIKQFVAHSGGTMNPDTKLFQILCEMAVTYRNHHQKSDLIDLLKRTGGKLSLSRTAEDIGSIRIIEGTSSLHELDHEARGAREALLSGDTEKALSIYEKVLPKMETIFADMNPAGEWEYVNGLLFSAVLLAIKGEAAAAQQPLLTCMNNRFLFCLHGYAALLLTNVDALREGAETVRKAFTEIPRDVPAHLSFDRFFEAASGHSYADANKLYDQFLVAAGDREMKKGEELSKQLLKLYDQKRNPLVPHSTCELIVRIFRACYFVLQGESNRAEREYRKAWGGEVTEDEVRIGFKRLSTDPEKILTHYFGD